MAKTIRRVLMKMETDLESLRSRLLAFEVVGWQEMTRREETASLRERWVEVVHLERGLSFLQARIGRIGRQQGDRTKVTPEMVQRIRQNGKTKVSALARELGISRQTIYVVLKDG
jgi:hypothetical protein